MTEMETGDCQELGMRVEVWLSKRNLYRNEPLSILTTLVDSQIYTYNKITENHTQEKLRKF